jgi:hypothetical protein
VAKRRTTRVYWKRGRGGDQDGRYRLTCCLTCCRRPLPQPRPLGSGAISAGTKSGNKVLRKRATYLKVKGSESAFFKDFFMVGFALVVNLLQFLGTRLLEKGIIAPWARFKHCLVGHQTQGQDADSAMPCYDDLGNRRHSYHVGAELVEQAAFSSGFEARRCQFTDRFVETSPCSRTLARQQRHTRLHEASDYYCSKQSFATHRGLIS